MKVPSFMHVRYVQKNGYLTEDMQLYHDELNTNMQNALSDNGWEVPQQSSSNISDVESSKPNGTIWYDEDNDVFKGKVGGVIKQFNMT